MPHLMGGLARHPVVQVRPCSSLAAPSYEYCVARNPALAVGDGDGCALLIGISYQARRNFSAPGRVSLSGNGNHVDLLRYLHGKRILVVEDDPLIALDLKATLERAGVVVLGPAGRLDDAMLLAERSLPVAAVLDVRLEVGTTLPLAKWLAERGVPFVFQTSDPSLIDAAYSAAPVLRKPFRPEQLIAALAALLAQER